MGIIGIDLFEVLFTLVFLFVLIVFVLTLVRGLRQWDRNNRSPRLTVAAVVVSKRTQVSHRQDANGLSHTATRYFATFEVESGDRMELAVSGPEYGMLAEGDRGRLTFQGTRYLGFERQ